MGWYPYDKFVPGDEDSEAIIDKFDSGSKEVTVDPSALNTDQLIAKMQADELEDAEAPLITPVNYAKIRPFSSQQIFYHIRANHLKVYICSCGRRCVNKEEADTYFRSVGKLDKGNG